MSVRHRGKKNIPWKVAVVTGGGNGIGRELCLRLANMGCFVAVNDILLESAHETVNLIRQNGGNADPYIFDVRDEEACSFCISTVESTHGNIDLLINNAGAVAIGDFGQTPTSSWHRIMDINFYGQLNMTKAVYPQMLKRQQGYIVFVSSIAGLAFQPLTGSYSASKHALVGMACTLFQDAKPNGIHISIACPGYVDNTSIFTEAESYGYHPAIVRNLLAKKIGGFTTPGTAAKKILTSVRRKKIFIVFPFNARLLWFFFRLMPALTVRYSSFLIKMVSKAKTTVE